MDATSLFYEIVPRPGADSAVTSFVTLLAVAEALGQLPDYSKQDMNNIMFAFFTGVSFNMFIPSWHVWQTSLDTISHTTTTALV